MITWKLDEFKQLEEWLLKQNEGYSISQYSTRIYYIYKNDKLIGKYNMHTKEIISMESSKNNKLVFGKQIRITISRKALYKGNHNESKKEIIGYNIVDKDAYYKELAAIFWDSMQRSGFLDNPKKWLEEHK